MMTPFDPDNTPARTSSATPIILDGYGDGFGPGRPDGEPGQRQSPLLDGLNPQQLEAVEYRGPSLLIIAGAGSGKTSVLTRRIASLLETREAYPSQILAITFTNKAAAEMRERAKGLIGKAAKDVTICTFHAMGVRMMRADGEALGLKPTFSILEIGRAHV